MKDILAEMGFNKEAPLETQKAFFKHLIAAANATSLQKYAQVSAENCNHTDESPGETKSMVQLEFDLSGHSSRRVS